MRLPLLILCACFLATTPILRAQAQPRVVIVGDSIAYDGRWTTRVESALRLTPAYADAFIVNLALPSETASGLSEAGHAGGAFARPCIHDRLAEILKQTKPTLVIACYGMNDGIFQPFDAGNFNAYKQGMERLVSTVRASGARIILLTPPLHGADKVQTSAQDYDNVLEAFSGWLNSKSAVGWDVIDIRPGLRAAISEEQSHGRTFRYAQDNVHPGDFGHRVIADATLAGLWPMLRLPGKPDVGSVARLQAVAEAQQALKLAWLSHIGHKRPGIPKGASLPEAERQAAAALDKAKTS